MSMESPASRLRAASAADAARLAEIYNFYVRETVVTFEEQPVSDAEMARRIADITARWPWLLAERAGRVVGYAYAGPWKPRSAYRHSVECTVYLEPAAVGRGDGRRLYEALLTQLPAHGAHVAIGGIALPNEQSIVLHEKCGFRKIGQFHEVGWKFGRWIDVGYWQKLL
jgi:L-amino acid N-acyltransferase YncA